MYLAEVDAFAFPYNEFQVQNYFAVDEVIMSKPGIYHQIIRRTNLVDL